MGLSFAEIAVILIVALIVIGPKKLPEVAKSVGKGYAEFRKAFNDIKKTVDISSFDEPIMKNKVQTYKSRWEEQVSAVDDATESAKSSTENHIEAKEASVVRAKKTDLIKEGEDDING